MAEHTEKIAFISGANRGLGFQTARHLGLTGVRVLLGAVDPESGKKAATDLKRQNIKAESIKFDLEQERDHINLREYVEKQFGRLDILVNNAGVTLEGNVSESGPINTVLTVPTETIRKTYEINFFGALRLTRTLLPLLHRSPAARIVNVSSVLGSLTLHSDPSKPLISEYKQFAYGGSKTLLNVLTVYLAHALRATPIKVNSAHPGWVKTDLGGAAAELDPEEGGKTSAQLALLDANGPTGGFFHLGEPLPW
jgi:NAD(P)-dependent dehydrogenase (short-subunit alcohol dehydrogenase family)